MQTSNRQTYLDWLRIMAIAGVLFFHSAMPFVESDWHIKNAEHSNMLLEFNFFISRFRMPLLFFISGAVAYFMLKNKSSGSFIGLRFKRLLIPLTFGVFTIVPLQVYMERVNQGFKGNFFEFYPTIFTTGSYPAGNFSWHHLWFIAYLFVYDVLFAPLFKLCIKNKDNWTFFSWLAQGKRIYFLMVPSIIVYAATVLRFPQTHALINDWSWIFYWLFFLLAGFVCMCFPALMQSLERNRRFSLSSAVITLLTLNYLRWNNIEAFDLIADYKAAWQTYANLLLYGLTAWFWVLAIVGYGRRYLNKAHPALNYINSAVYPFYILHQTVIVVLAFYVVKTPDEVLMKYCFLVVATFLISMLIYHLFIRPFAVTRFLFGAKNDKEIVIQKEQKRKPEYVETL